MSAAETAGRLRELIRLRRESCDARFERVDVTVRRRRERITVGGLTTSRELAGEIRAFLGERPCGEVADRLRLAASPVGESALAEPSAPVVNLREAPSHASQLLTQAVMGETLELLHEEDGWALVRAEDGYLGWTALRGIVPLPAGGRGEGGVATPDAIRVTALYAPLREKPRDDAPTAGRAPFDALLPLVSRKEPFFAVRLPAGGEAWIAARHAAEESGRPRHFEPHQLLECLRRMIGVPYLWGGSTTLGFDCSGLVQRVYRHHKIMLPRDSDLQARAVDDLSRNRERREGDLLFFGGDRVDHVAIAAGPDEFVHASGSVRIESLDDESPCFRADLRARFLGSGSLRNFGIRGEATDLFGT